LKRLEQQAGGMNLSDMLTDLPTACDLGTKKNSNGYKTSWTGYKLHMNVADDGIPIISVSAHVGQVALSLAHMSRERVTNLYNVITHAGH
jgi:hypothetical protein